MRTVTGLEIFDDWLVRHIERLDSVIRFPLDEGWNRTSSRSSNIPIEVVLEAPIPADEVELHIEAAGTRRPVLLAPSTVQSLDTESSKHVPRYHYLLRKCDCRTLGTGSVADTKG